MIERAAPHEAARRRREDARPPKRRPAPGDPALREESASGGQVKAAVLPLSANLKDLPWGNSAPEHVHAIIEIPRGTRAKYEYDVKLGVFRLDRVLAASMFYPTAYGFVPSTLAPDGDPMDILVLISEPLNVGVMVEARPIGVLHTTDEKGGDDKILAVADGDPIYRDVRELSDVSEEELQQIEHFFTTYKVLERKNVVSRGWTPRPSALDGLRAGHKRYVEEHSRK